MVTVSSRVYYVEYFGQKQRNRQIRHWTEKGTVLTVQQNPDKDFYMYSAKEFFFFFLRDPSRICSWLVWNHCLFDLITEGNWNMTGRGGNTWSETGKNGMSTVSISNLSLSELKRHLADHITLSDEMPEKTDLSWKLLVVHKAESFICSLDDSETVQNMVKHVTRDIASPLRRCPLRVRSPEHLQLGCGRANRRRP
jgi:hypothetical protein